MLDQLRRCLNRSCLEHLGERGHGWILTLRESSVFSRQYSVVSRQSQSAVSVVSPSRQLMSRFF